MRKLFTLFFAVILLQGGFKLNGQDLYHDSLALVDIYKAIGGPNWTNQKGWLTDSVKNWGEGAVTVSGGRVTKLSLGLGYANDTISPSIGNLTALTDLQLNGDDSNPSLPGGGVYTTLHGKIPKELWNCTALKKIQIKLSKITSWDTTGIYKLTALEELNLEGIKVGGPLPAGLFTLPNLAKVYLHYCNFTGDVPATLTRATKLTRLYLWGGSRLSKLPYVNITKKIDAKLEFNDNYFTFAEIKAYADSSAKYGDFSKNTEQLKQDTIKVTGYEGYSYKFSEKVTGGTSYKWYKDTIKTDNLLSSDSTYTIATLSAVNQGKYECAVENSAVTNINGSGTVTPFKIVVLYQLTVNAPPSPTVVSAVTDALGTKVNLTFNKAMVNPAAFASSFSVKINGTSGAVKKVSLDASDSKVIIVELNTAVKQGEVVLLSYIGTSVTAEDNGILASITDQAVTNNVHTGVKNYETVCSIFPNPFSEKIEIKGEAQIKAVSIYDVLGKSVLELKDLSDASIAIPVAALKPGVYMILVKTANDSSLHKLVKN